MEKTLSITHAYFLATLSPLRFPRHGRMGFSLSRPRRAAVRLRMSLGDFPQPPQGLDAFVDLERLPSFSIPWRLIESEITCSAFFGAQNKWDNADLYGRRVAEFCFFLLSGHDDESAAAMFVYG